MHRLRFRNLTAESDHSFLVQGDAVADIMQWYGCFYAGDDYGVTVDGHPVAMDQNGFHDPSSELARIANLT